MKTNFNEISIQPALKNAIGILSQNKGHIIRFIYLTGGTVLQIAVLNFVIYPYLSRQITDSKFGELLLLMTTINFYITTLGAPAIMAFYRQFRNIPPDETSQFFGTLLQGVMIGMVALGGMNVLLYDIIAAYWQLTFTQTDFFYLLCYMGMFVIDMLLLARTQYDYNFTAGFYSRVIFFFCSFIVIPVYTYYPENWLFSFAFAPAASSLTLYIILLRKGQISFTWANLNKYLPELSKNYLFFLLTCISSQLMIYCDRWLLASYNIPKAEIAYFTIAVQACSLIVFPVDRVSDLMMPSVTNISEFNSISRTQARKSLLALAASMIYVVTFGLVIGLLFFKLYKPTYYEQGWKYFIILLIGTFFYAIQSFSRSFLIRFFPIRYMLVPQTIATLLQIGVTILLFTISGDPISAAIGRVIGFSLIALVYYRLCQSRIMKIAFAKIH
jgi:O-antigen/teichoic acid export membrane protein